MSTPTLYVHVGASKSGTSTLQASLWRSVDQLAAHGVAMPFVGRGAHLRRVLRPMGWVSGEGYRGDIDTEAMQAFGRRLRRRGGDGPVIMSNEDLAEAPAPAVRAFHEAVHAAGFTPHTIVTTRSWAQQLPSEWQQFLKARLQATLPEFLEAVRHRRGHFAERFRARQTVPEICERWMVDGDPSTVHVLPLSAHSRDPDRLWNAFSEATGIDPGLLDRTGSGDINRSYGYVEAEVLRRINVSLGDRLSEHTDYRRAVRSVLARRVLARGASARLALPPSDFGWVSATMEEHVAAVAAGGFQVHGELEGLLVREESCVEPPELDEADVAGAAIDTLVEFALTRLRETTDSARADDDEDEDEDDDADGE